MRNSKKTAIFFVNSLQNGGAERVVVNQATELLKRGYDIDIILVHDEVYYQIPTQFNIHVLYKKTTKIDKFLKQKKLAKKLDNVIDNIRNSKKIVLMSVHLPFAHRIARYSKYRDDFLFVMHNSQFQYRFSNTRFFKQSVKRIYDNKKIISVSKGVENELINDIGVSTQYITTIYNPIDIATIQRKQFEKTTNKVEAQPYILFVGRLNPEKRIDRLLKAFKISGLNKKYKLVILGVGSLEEELKAKAATLNIDQSVEFNGWEKNVYPWMRNAEMLVSSSDYESFGMVIVEALTCGCKVVSTRCKFGPEEILTGVYANYLSNLDSRDLAAKMNKAINDYPVITDNLVTKFDGKYIMDQYLKIFFKWSDK